MGISLTAANALESVIDEKIRNAAAKRTRTPGVVNRVDTDGTVYVIVEGSETETPASDAAASVQPGDAVNCTVSGGRLTIDGNYSDPSAGVARVSATERVANIAADGAQRAQAAAEQAESDAVRAHDAADAAQDSADSAHASALNANEYASRALGGLSTVQSVSETLAWITQHGTMALTSDTEPDPMHVYFVADANGDYVVGGTHYSIVSEPDAADMSSYYELTIDESLNNYVGTHLALTEDGLWLLPASSGTNKVLIATGAGSLYTEAGTYIIDGTGATVARFGAEAVLGDESGTHAVVDASGLQVYDESGNPTAGFFADGSRIGADESTHLSLSDEGLVGYTSDGKPAMTVDMDVGTVTEQVQPEMSKQSQFTRIQKNSTNVTAVSKSLVDISSGSSAVWVGGNQSVQLNFKGTMGIGTPTVSTGITATVTFNQVVTLTLTSDASQTVGTANTKSYTASFTVRQHVGGVGDVDYPITVTISRKMLTSTNRAQLELSVKNGSTSYVYDKPIVYSIYGYFPRITIDAIAPAFMFGDDYESPGMYTAAIGRGLQAASDYQTVLGKYNVADSSDAYALIVGNGTAATRSNALAVQWSGLIDVAGTPCYPCFVTTAIANFSAPVSPCMVLDTSDYGLYWYTA